VVFVNDHIRSATLGQAVLGMNLQNVKVRPLLGQDPVNMMAPGGRFVCGAAAL
jgi:hypothetical protein